MQQCLECKKYRIEQEFGNNKLTTVCKSCSKPIKEVFKKAIKKYRKYALKRFYGMTLEDYDTLLLSQDGKCVGCKDTNPHSKSGNFHIDHSHLTGRVRGLMCSRCNTALGLMNEDLTILANLKLYLENNSPKNTQLEAA